MVSNKNSGNKNTAKSRSFSSGFGRAEYGGEADRVGQRLVRTSQREAALPSHSRLVRTSGGEGRFQHSTSTSNYSSGVGGERSFRFGGGANRSATVTHHTQSNQPTGAYHAPSRGGASPTPFLVSSTRHSMAYPYTGPSGSGQAARSSSPGRGGGVSPTPFLVPAARTSYDHIYTGPSGQAPQARGSSSPGRGGGSPTPFLVSSTRHSMAYPYTGPSGSGVLNTSTSGAGASAAAPFRAGGAVKHKASADYSSSRPSTHPATHSEILLNDFDHDMAMHEWEEPSNQRGGSVADSVVHREHHQSEHSRQYPWPPMAEPTRSYRPAVSHSPMVHTDSYTDADMYQSEYAVRCAELKAKQRELMSKAAASQAAGRERAGKSPARAALDRVAGAAPAVIPYNVGLSESKMKFTWKEGEPAVPVAPKESKLNLFRTADGDLDALRADRDQSVAKQDYVLHAAADIMRGIQERTENQNSANVKSHMSLAWDDTEAEPKQMNKSLNRSTRDNYGPGQAFSEYTRKYTWKEADRSAASPVRPKPSNAGESLNLFGGKPDLGASSEYNLQYVNHDLDHSGYRPEPIAGVVSKTDEAYPSQFAWGAPPEADEDENVSHRRLNPQNNPNVLSEYHRKYLWHDPQPRASPTKKPEGDTGAEKESILGLDRHALQTSQWRSEYEDTYHRTALDASRGVYLSPVAGVSTRQTGSYPTNYAWKDEPQPSVVPSPKRRAPADLPMTEYEAKFYEMPLVEQVRPKPKKVQEGERLNLFDEEPQQQPSRLKSEYTASFKAFDAADRVKAIRNKGSENPAQFAWSVIDGEAPKPVYVKKRPSGPVETSEYNSKYQWLQGDSSSTLPPPAGIVSNVKPGHSDTSNPIAEAPESVSEWASEASRSAAAVTLRPNMAPAGMRSSFHGEIPTFYAWEPEVQTVVHKPVRFPGEVVHSEYEDRFKAWGAVPRPTTAPAAAPSAGHNTQLDLFGESRPFEEITEHRAQFVNKEPAAAPSAPAGRVKAPQEELPTQFAWPLVDGERVKEPVRRPVNPTAVQLSEYDTKYSWPQQIPAPPTASAAKKLSADSGIFPREESAKDWQSEADARFSGPAAVDPATVPGTAGVSSEKPPAAPSFYAWPEVPPSEAPPRPVHQWEPVQSEYGDKFVSKVFANAGPRSEPVRQHDTLNLFVPKQPFDRERLEGITEYDDKFRGASTGSAAALVPCVDTTPHQFAWPLVDGERKKEPVQPRPPSDHPFQGITEHDAQYHWPSTKDTLACKTLIRPVSATLGKPSVILPGPVVHKSEQWQSEYDARCALLKQRQQAVTDAAKAEAEVPPAGIPTIRAQQSPTYYAWRKSERPKTPVKVNCSSLNGITEYDAQYIWKGGCKDKAPSELPNAGLLNSLAVSKDSLETSNRLNPQGLPFVGVSEYDDKFASATRGATSSDEAAGVIHSHQEKSLRGTNIEQGAEDAEYSRVVSLVSAPRVNAADLPTAGLTTEALHTDRISAAAAAATPRPHSVHVYSGAKGSYSTETSDKYRVSTTAAAATSSSAASVTDGQLKQKNCTACHPDKENVYGNSSTSCLGESESRAKFSWPTRRKVTTTSGTTYSSPRKVSPGRRVYYSNSPNRSHQQQQIVSRPVSSFAAASEETASVNSSATSTVSTQNKQQTQTSAAVEDSSSARAVQPTTATSATIESSTSTLGTSSKKTPSDTQMSVASSGCGASSSTITSVRNVDAAPVVNVDRSGRSANYVEYQQKNRANDSIPGLRYPLDAYQRSRSAPPRRLVSQSFTDHRYKAKMFVDQDTTSNPVLIHKRYPHHSDRQLGRWSTETRDKFNWKRVTNASGSSAVNTSFTN